MLPPEDQARRGANRRRKPRARPAPPPYKPPQRAADPKGTADLRRGRARPPAPRKASPAPRYKPPATRTDDKSDASRRRGDAQRRRDAADRRRRTRQTLTPLQPPGDFAGQARQVERQLARVERKVFGPLPLPAIPQIDFTPAQRQAALALTRRSVAGQRRQGLTTREISRARRYGDPQTRERLERALGAQRTQVRDMDVKVGLRAIGAPRNAKPKPGKVRELAAIGRAVRLKNAAEVKPGRGHRRVGIGPASVDVTPLARAISGRVVQGHGVAAANFLSKDVPRFAGRVGSDVANLPKNAVIGLYEAGAAGVEAGQTLPGVPGKGSTSRGERLIRGLDDGVVGRLAHGDVEGAAKAFSEHPLYGLLEVTGTGQVAGRVAGAAGRSGALGGRAKRAASTRRQALELVAGTGQTVNRRYSPNLLVKAIQVAGESAARRRGRDPNRAANSPIPGRGRSAQLNAAVDEFAAQAEGVRRRGRETAARSAARIAPTRRGDASGSRGKRAVAAVDRRRGRAERDVVFAAVEGRLRGPKTFREDLVRERDRLQQVYRGERGGMSRSSRLANREQVKAIDRVLDDPKALANAGEVFRAADEYAGQAKRLEGRMRDQGLLDADQATAARVRPYGVAVMGLRPSRAARAPEELVVRHEQARAVEAKARETLKLKREAVHRLASERDRLVGAQRVTRGRDATKAPQKVYVVGDKRTTSRAEAEFEAERTSVKIRTVAATLSESKRTGELSRVTRALAGAKVDRRRAEAAWKQARRDRVRSKPKRYVTGLEDAKGRPVSTAEILRHIAQSGSRNPAFVSHRRDQQGARSFFVNWFDRRPTVDAKRRTGEATRTGAHAADFRALEEHMVRGQGVVDAVGSFDRFVGQFGTRRPDGKPFTYAEAVTYADRIQDAPDAVPMVPVRVVPARLDAATRDRVLDRQGTAAAPDLESLTVARLDEALKEPPGGQAQARNVVLVPSSR